MSQPAAVSGLRCSYSADERADPLAGSAAHAKGFVLIESPGAWGYDALKESRLDAEIASAVAAKAAEALYRVILIKRPGRAAASASRSWFVVDSTPGAEKVSSGTYHSDSELLEIPLHIEEHEPTPQPMYLVCTHGRHDACCAQRGRPVAARLAEERPGLVWECSHIGGDRFAPNVLVLPHGLYYGRVEPERAPEIIAAQERSEVVVDLLRGRTVFRPAVQAAQHFARAARDGRVIDDFRPIAWESTASGDVRVDLAHAGDRLAVVVRPTVGPDSGFLTCRASHALHPPTFELCGISS